MFEKWVSKRKSPHLQKALLLRKKGNFKEALDALNYACDVEKDAEALYFKADAYVTGGFYLEKNIALAEAYYREARLAGCEWPDDQEYGNTLITEEGHILLYVNVFSSYEKKEMLKYAAESGDAYAQYRVSDCDNEFTNLACYQKNDEAIQHAVFAILNGNRCGCKYDLLKMAQIFIETKNIEGINIRIGYVFDHELRLEELYIYGKNIHLFDQSLFLPEHIENAYSVYLTSWTKAQDAVVFWLMWTKKERLLCPDMQRFIGKLIWESRSKPQVWGVKLMGEFEKLQKKKKKKMKI
jgi:tetratricopeptide (TPR) repeat protein